MRTTLARPAVLDLDASATPDAPDASAARKGRRSAPWAAGRSTTLLGTLVIAAGILLGLSGAGTWALVQTSLSAEHITVSADAAHFGGQQVNGPLTAYYQADIIKHHSLTASGGKTYAQLDKADPVRATVMNGSFLRASLFTSVVSFGIAAMAMGLGLIFVLIGFALRATARDTRAVASDTRL
jgi:hypothetical protein